MNSQSKAVVFELALFASADVKAARPNLTESDLDIIESKLRTYVRRNVVGQTVIHTLILPDLNLSYRREYPLAWENRA